jgi:hypothetical protein
MKRKLSAAEIDFGEKEADQLLLAQVVAEEDAELRQRSAAAKQAIEDQVLRDRLAKWDELGLVCAADVSVSRPPPFPSTGSLPFSPACRLVVTCYRIRT